MPSKPDGSNAAATPTPTASSLNAEQAKWLIQGAIEHAIFMFDPHGMILTWNPGVNHILGYREDEWVGRNVAFFYTPEDRDKREPELERERAAGEGRAEDLRWHVRRDGSRIWADGVVTPVYDDVDTLIGFAKIMRDATSRKQAQTALWHAEERLRLAASAAQIGTFDYDPKTDVLNLDDRCKALFGLPADARTNGYDAFLAGVHPDDRDAADRAIKRALDPENGGGFSVRYRTVDVSDPGVIRWLSVKGQASFDSEARVERFVGSAVDVTVNQTTGEALRRREEFLRRVLESSPDCIKTLSLDGIILDINERGAELLEIDDVSKFCGAEWVTFWSGAEGEAARQAIADALAGGTGRFQGNSQTQKGADKWWDVAVTPIRDAAGDPERLLVVSRDITAQHAAQAKQDFLSNLSERFRTLEDPEAVVWETVRSAGVFFGLSRFLYAEIDDAAGTLQVTRDWSDPQADIGTSAGTWGFAEWSRKFASWGAILDELRAGRTAVVNDFAADPHTAFDFASDASGTRVRAAVMIPLQREGKWVALLSAQSLTPRDWQADDVAALEAVAERTWLTLENARLQLVMEWDAEREREYLTGIFMQAPAFMAALSGPQHVFEMANPPYYALIGNRDIIGKPVVEALPEVASDGFMALLDGVYRNGVPYVGKDVTIHLNDPGTGQLEERYLDFTYQPLFNTDGDVSGVLVHGIDLTGRKRLEQERERLHEAQSRLLAATSARAEREAILNRIGEAVRAATEPDEIVSIAVTSLGQALGLDRCFFNMFNPERTVLRIGADWHRADLPSIAGQYPSAVFERVINEFYGFGTTVVIEDVEKAPLSTEARAVQARYGNRALLGVALREAADAGGAAPIVATLGASMVDSPRAWTEDDIYLVQSVATAIKTAMETARIRQRERNIAVQLQDALIPHAPENPPGLALGSYYQPALDEAGVGGDAFDVFPVNAGCTALCVFDLSGKGLTAASQVATVKNMLRYAVFSEPSLVQAITSLNRVIVDHELLTGFATLFIGLYEHESATLRYVNCGQEPGIVCRAATQQIELLMPTGPVLGGFGAGAFFERSIPLAPNDILALFTDGLTEVGATRKDLLEIEGVCAILQECARTLSPETPSGPPDPDAIVACLIAGVDSFARGGARDDIALLVGVVRPV